MCANVYVQMCICTCICVCTCTYTCTCGPVYMHENACVNFVYGCLVMHIMFVCNYVLYIILFYSEESSKIVGVGVDQLLKDGKLEKLKDGPVFWVDSADSQPCMGTASAVMWTLKCRGRLFHSGLPHKVQ